MSVNPGFGGQAFIPAAIDKLRDLRTLVGARPIDIEIDGGITSNNTGRVVQAGANVLVAGSAVFKGGNYKGNIAAIRNAAALARGEAACPSRVIPVRRWPRSGRQKRNSDSGSRSTRTRRTPWRNSALSRERPQRKSGKKAMPRSSTSPALMKLKQRSSTTSS